MTTRGEAAKAAGTDGADAREQPRAGDAAAASAATTGAPAGRSVPTRDEVPAAERWDPTRLYADDAAWEAELAQVDADRDALLALRGRVGASVETLTAALAAEDALSLRLERLGVHALLRRDEDTANAAAQARYERLETVVSAVAAALAFLAPELLALPEERLAAYADDPALAAHRHGLRELLRHRPHVRSAEVEAVLAAAGELARVPQSVFTALDNADLDLGTLDDGGVTIALTKGQVARLLQRPERPIRAAAAARLASVYAAHRHSLAALLGGSVRGAVFAARQRGHASAIEAALFSHAIPTAVYDGLVTAVASRSDAVGRALALRRRVLGLDALHAHDLAVPLAAPLGEVLDYPAAVETVLTALAPLGARYAADLGRGLREERWVDVRETRHKRSGAYNVGCYGATPHLLLNWTGTRADVAVLAHEAGHAMHSFYANAAQPHATAHYAIFTAEVASTVNETLLTWHLLDRAADEAERFALLARFLDSFRGTVIRQTMFAAFERWTHEAIESGAALTADALTAAWRTQYATFFPGVTQDAVTDIEWARIPHFYMGFYVYQYATGLAAAIALARGIRDEGQPAVDRYLAFLAAGGSDHPIALLRAAGVDMATPGPVLAALDEFAARTDEATAIYERASRHPNPRDRNPRTPTGG